MILIVGGIASGKRAYARSLGYTDTDMDEAVLGHGCVLYGLETLLRSGALDAQQIDAVKNKDVVCCCEVGMGVVPVDGEERAWRELVGRTCTELAKDAHEVVRMVCGIPVLLKDTSEVDSIG
ncbi:MAG: bifunctional adenosylcobinamide kinase/adenosylcobinamide-phosphate guanylyltransferase [Atopobiaceae bacterium]|nr:bifunctional adenosylcobinamide kinase/adenosylcobinamide-phosphate guanylyltransferase [Atopobiaceae bacterium]